MKRTGTYRKMWMLAFVGGLSLGGILLYRTYRRVTRECIQLRAELAECREKELQSVRIQRVSKQMEEIAYQQKDISERRREEAVAQTQKANLMQRQAEAERERAWRAQKEAEKAYQIADTQKRLAMQRQLQAEQSKRIADTLAFLALGRSLGSLSVTQYQTGNTELAMLLGYAAWKFTQRYRGDVYHPAIFNALSCCSKQDLAWFRHKGALAGILPVDGDGHRFITVSKYGEMLLWGYDGKQSCRSKALVENSHFDFRDLFVQAACSYYALSYTGEIVHWHDPEISVCPLPLQACKTWIPTDSGHILVVGKQGICAFECRTHKVSFCYSPDCEVLYAGKCRDRVYVFLEDGRIAILTPQGQFVRYSTAGLENRRVTAFCALANEKYAIGCKDGAILICNAEGKVLSRLVGHQGAITAIRQIRNLLFSGSYDRTLRLWDMGQEKPEAAVILSNTAWIHSFYIYPDGKYIFIGDEQGKLHRISISPDNMATAIQQDLKRDFTREEWDYYMGSQVPFESYRLKGIRL